jgi:hypothetical protein
MYYSEKFPNSYCPTYVIENRPTQATLQRILWSSPTDVRNVNVEWKYVFLLYEFVINRTSDNSADLTVLAVY